MKILQKTEKKETIEFQIQLDKKTWEQFHKKGLQALAKKLKVQGFRQGKAPVEMAKSMIGNQAIIQKALELANREIIDEIIKSADFEESRALERVVDFKLVDFKDEAPVLAVSFEMMPKIENFDAKDLKKLEVPTFEEKPIDEKFLETNVNAFIKEDAMIMDKKENKVGDGDVVIIDFDGYIDDKQFPGGKAENYELEIGSHSFIDNFEQQLIGHKKNDKLEVHVTFPKDYHSKDHAGKKALFKVKINDIKTIEYPMIDAKYLESKFIKNVKNRQELKQYIKNIFIEEQKIKYREQIAQILNKFILENVKVDFVPDLLTDSYKQRILSQYQQEAKQNKLSLDDYLKKLKVSQKDFQTILNKNAHDNVIVALGYEKLLEDLKLEVTEKDKEQLLEKFERYFKNKEKAKEMFEKNTDYHESLLLKDKLLDKIPTIAKIAETKK